ncbi:MAG: flagellar basal body rod protein FlgC [Caulobacteraceae bacterium]
MTSSVSIAQSGLVAAMVKLNASASNVANADDTAAVGQAGAFQPTQVTNSPVPGGGVKARATTVRPSQILAFDPTSPLANAQGLVETPEIDPIAEVSNQLAASHAFAFSLKVLQAANNDEETLLNLKT